MSPLYKVILCMLLLFAADAFAQTYAPYTTHKAKPAAEKKPEKRKENKTAKVTKPEPRAVETVKPAEKAVTENPVAEPVSENPAAKPVVEKPAKEDIPADFLALLQKASQQYKEKKFEEAVKTYTEALAISPDNYKHHVLLMRGYGYFGMKESNKAIQDCTTAIEKTKLPHDNALGNIVFLRSLAYKERKEAGDKERACADYKKARETGFIRGDHVFGFEDCE